MSNPMPLQHIQAHPLLAAPGTSLLAVSGGLDSITLVDLFAKAQHPFAIAHANFGLRGQASIEDATFVEQLARKYQVPYHTKTLDPKSYAKKHQVSIQMAARTLRYRWFEQLIQEKHYVRIVTAHHHNDQVETILRNFIQGTGIVGMAGMPAQRGPIVRPLLTISKETLLHHALQNKLTWREDLSNQSTKYDRNQIRHHIIPALQTLNPSWPHTMKATLERLQASAAIFQAHAAHWKSKVWKPKAPCIQIQYPLLLQQVGASLLLATWLAPFGFSWNQIQKWCANPPQSGKQIHSKTHWLLADRKAWVLAPHTATKTPTHHLPQPPSQVALPNHLLKVSAPQPHDPNSPLPQTKNEARLDYHKLTFPLLLRPWQPGDLFCPIGMSQKHKKVSDLLIDAKVPRHDKPKTYVLTSGGQIAWVLGHRIDDRFKLTPHTQQQITCTLIPKPILR